ncbi:MAG: regulatory protein GemA [Mesorhizobium sp.]
MTALAAIHVARKQLGLDEDTYRALALRVTGESSAGAMSEAQRGKLLEEMRRLGFSRAAAAPLKPPSKRIQGPYGKKLQALWIAMWHLGLTRDRTDDALVAFVLKRVNVDHMLWLVDPVEGRKVVEALKDWIAREAGVEWTQTHGRPWLKHDAAKIAWAQWRTLNSLAALGTFDEIAFSEAVWTALGRPERFGDHTINTLTLRDWQQVNKAWGAEVRRRRRS